MLIRCIASSGCYISNRHNDSWSSHGADVQQRGCLEMAQGDTHVLNITFTQNPLNGLVAIWDDASAPTPGSPPGSGVEIGSDTDCPPPACPGGIYPLFTPILGGSYVSGCDWLVGG